MDEVKESEQLAEKLTTKATFEISAKTVKEFDSLMIEIKKKKDQYITFSLDVTCKWETMQIHIDSVSGIDRRIVKAKNINSDHWSAFVNRIRDVETEIITYLNSGKQEGGEGIVPVFSCDAKLNIEYKDREAQKALEDDKQMFMFLPINIREERYRKEVDSFIEDLKPDGKRISSIKFQQIGSGAGEPVVLTSK